MRALEHIRRLPKKAQAAALGHALRIASEDECRVLCPLALEAMAVIGRSDGLTQGLLVAWPRLDDQLKSQVLLSIGEAFARSVLGLPPEQGAAVAADCIAQDRLHELLVGLGNDPLEHPEFLRLACSRSHHCPKYGDPARRAVVRCSVLVGPRDNGYSAECRSIVDRELVEWARNYDEHRDDRVLRAVLASTQCCGPRLDAWLSGRHQDEHLPLRAVAGRVDLPVAAGMAIGWLGWSALVPAARRVFERVIESGDTELAETLLEPWVLLRSRERGGRVRSVLTPKQLNRLHAMHGLSAHARRGALEMARHLGAAGMASLTNAGVVADPDPRVRMAAVQAMADADASDALDDALEDFSYDRVPSIALLAVGALGRARSRHRRIANAERLRGLTRSADARVRAAASRMLDRNDPMQVPTGEERRWWCPETARWMLGRSRDTYVDALRQLLSKADAAGTAIELVRRLGLTAELCEHVIRVARAHPDNRARANAALLLGVLGREGAAQDQIDQAFTVLADMLGDADERVRANAIEGLSMLRGESIRLDRFATDPSARARANAIRHASVWIEPRGEGALPSGALTYLAQMLDDERVEHRLSALWVVSRCRPHELAATVAALAREDGDPLVRTRARQCAARLLSAMEPTPREVAVG